MEYIKEVVTKEVFTTEKDYRGLKMLVVKPDITVVRDAADLSVGDILLVRTANDALTTNQRYYRVADFRPVKDGEMFLSSFAPLAVRYDRSESFEPKIILVEVGKTVKVIITPTSVVRRPKPYEFYENGGDIFQCTSDCMRSEHTICKVERETYFL